MSKANPEVKKKIRGAIRLFFIKNADSEFYGWQLYEFVRREVYLGGKYQSTILRYLRQLQAEGLINYVCLLKSDSLYKTGKL